MDTNTDGVVYWQHNKTASECHRYMFENSLNTDVVFRIEHSGESDKDERKCTTIRAHKYILVCRSPVFCAMVRWSKEFDSCNEIVLDDADPEAFYHMLRFMYTDTIDLEPHLVMHIWYLAKKYLLSTLETLCIDYLDNQITPNNAAIIYDQSLFFEEKRLARKCLKILTLKTTECLQAPSFVDIQKTALSNISGLDTTTCNEVEMFKACYKWAKNKCEEINVEPNPSNVRQTLGDIMDKIRFPAMDLPDFKSVVLPTQILTVFEATTLLRQIENNLTPPHDTLPYSHRDRCYKEGQKIELLSDTFGETKEIAGPVAQYDLELDTDTTISLHDLLLFDFNVEYNNKIPQGNECLLVKISLNGAELFDDHHNKYDTAIRSNIKRLPLYGLKLNAGQHTISIKHIWKGKCFHCGNFAQCGSTLGAQFCYNCGNYSGLRPTPMTVSKKSLVTFQNNLVTIRIRNQKETGMPVFGFIFSDPQFC